MGSPGEMGRWEDSERKTIRPSYATGPLPKRGRIRDKRESRGRDSRIRGRDMRIWRRQENKGKGREDKGKENEDEGKREEDKGKTGE